MTKLQNKVKGLVIILGFAGVAYVGFFKPPTIIQCVLKWHSECLFQNGLKSYRKGDLLQAEKFWRQSLSEQETDSFLKFQESESANNLGYTLSLLGKDKEAETLLKRAIKLRRECRKDGSTGTSLYILGRFYLKQGRLKEAEPLLREALAINSRVYGPRDQDTVVTKRMLNELLKKRSS